MRGAAYEQQLQALTAPPKDVHLDLRRADRDHARHHSAQGTALASAVASGLTRHSPSTRVPPPSPAVGNITVGRQIVKTFTHGCGLRGRPSWHLRRTSART